MKKILLLLLFCGFNVITAQTNFTPIWAKAIGDPAGDDNLEVSAVDAGGNICIGGKIDGVIDFDPGPGVTSYTHSNKAYLAKYSPSGSLLFAGIYVGDAESRIYSIDFDSNSNIYVYGYFAYGYTDFDIGAGTYSLAANNSDFFVAKYNSSGVIQWAINVGDPNSTLNPYKMEVTSGGSVVVTGDFTNFVDFDPSIGGVTTLTSNAQSDVYVATYDNAGNFNWAKSFGGSGIDQGYGIDVDASGNVAVTGTYEYTVDLDPGAGTTTVISEGSQDIFVSKFSSTGVFLWGGSMGGPLSDVGGRVKFNSTGEVIVSSAVQSSTFDVNPLAGVTPQIKIGDPGYNDILLSKLNGTNGALVWSKVGAPTGQNNAVGAGLHIDSQNNIFLAGNFSGVMDFDMNGGTYTLTPQVNPFQDIFVAKYDNSNANLIFAFNMGGGNQAGTLCRDVSVKGDTLFLAGVHTNTMDMDPGAGTFSLDLLGGSDFYISKFNYCTLPALSGITGSTFMCGGQSATLSLVNPQLNDATQWSWYQNACNNGTVIGTGTSLTVSPVVTTTYYVNGTGGCVPPGGSCLNMTITINPNTHVTGTITSNTITPVPVSGQVLLFKYEPNLTKFDTIMKQAIGVGGAYSFSSVPSGSYIVQAVPGSNTLVPTYSPDKVGWKDAQEFFHGCAVNDVKNINVIEVSNWGVGTGMLTGKVVEGSKYGQKGANVTAPGAPIKGISVKGGRNPGGSIGAQDRTLPGGTYTLSGIPNNVSGESYFVFVDIAGLDTAGTYHKVIMTGSDQYFNLDFVVDSAKIHPAVFVGLNESKIERKNFRIYPNPSNGKIYIECELESPSQLSIEMFDLMGKNVASIYPSAIEESKQLTILSDQSKLSSGIYFLKLKVNDEVTNVKLIINN